MVPARAGHHGEGREDATQEYREEMDTFALFLAVKCVVSPRGFATSAGLHHAYNEWADEMGEKPLSQTKLGRANSRQGGSDPEKTT